MSTNDEMSTTTETIQKVHDMVMKHRRLKVREIIQTLGISNDRVYNILKEHLHMKRTTREMGAAFAHT